MVSEMVMQP
jgi:hypothetical protein